MDLSIIIVNYETFELTKQAINSILKKDHLFTYEIILVDSASSDNSLNQLKSYFSDDVKFIASKTNEGFASANNKGLKIAKGQYILLLNSDTIVKEDTLDNIYEYMENHKDVGAVGSKVVLKDGSLDKACKRSFPNYKNSFYKFLPFLSKKSSLDDYNLDILDNNEIHEIDCLTGAFMFIRKSTLDEVGELDETFFMYGEDIDLCYRIKEKGWKIVYYGKNEITHLKGSSSQKQKFKLLYHFYKSMYIFYKKHYMKANSIFINIIVVSGIAILFFFKAIINLFKSKN